MSKDKEKIVLVESSCVGADYMGRAVANAGYEPIYLGSRSGSQGDTRAQMRRYRYLECDTSSAPAMASALDAAKLDGVVAALSFCDTYIMNAIGLARALGVRSQAPVLERLKDKWEVLRLIPEYSPATIAFEAAAPPLEQIRTLLAEHGGVIVKGRRSSGGLGATFSATPSELDASMSTVTRTVIPAHLAPNLWLAQAVVQGELVSLEGFVSHGVPTFLGFSGRRKVGMSEAMILFPWDDQIAPPARERAKQAVTALIQRSELASGYFHVEFIVSGESALVIDANMGRIGGGGLGQQIALAYGISPVEVHAHLLALALGEPIATPPAFSSAQRTSTASVMYGIPVEARLRAIRAPAGIQSMHTVIVDRGELIPPMGTDNYAWVGIASGIAEQVESDVRRLRIETDRGEFAPSF
jgi:hypothetical protein